MRVGYRLIRYAGDPAAGAGEVFALVALGPGSAAVRALGLDREGTVDTAPFERLASVSAEDAWIYREWVNWLRDLVAGEPVEWISPILDRLALRGTGVRASAVEFFEIRDDQDQDIERIADHLFAEVVGKASGPG